MSTLANPVAIAGAAGSWTGAGDLSDWFVWTAPATGAPASGQYVFDTRNYTNYNTTLHIYLLSAIPHNPVQISDLTEVAYIIPADQTNGYGYEVGALVAFTPTPGKIYYIGTASRDTNSTGQLGLEWGTYYRLALGGCQNCTAVTGGLCKAGTAVASPQTGSPVGIQSFGSMPAGIYQLTICPYLGNYPTLGPGGIGEANYIIITNNIAANFVLPNGPSFFVQPYVGPFNCTPGQVFYDAPGLAVCIKSASYSNGPNFNDGNWDGVPDSELIFLDGYPLNPCFYQAFCHTGGDVSILWTPTNNVIFNSTYGMPAVIYNFDPSTQVELTVNGISNEGVASGGGYNYGVTIDVQNINLNFKSEKFTLVLNTSSTLSNPSAPITFDLDADGTGSGVFTFTSTAFNQMFATFSFLDCNGNPVGNPQTILLASAIAALGSTSEVSCGSNAPLAPVQYNFSVFNFGIIPFNQFTVSVTPVTAGGILFADPATAPCTGPFPDTVFTITINTVIAPFGGTPRQINSSFTCQRASLNQSQHQQATFLLTVDGFVFPGGTLNINLN